MSQSSNNTSLDNDEPFDPWGYKPQAQIELYIVTGILIFLSIVGTAGNLLVLYVFSKKRDKLVSTLFILVMAFVDFITCLLVIPYTVAMEYTGFWVKYDVICKLYHFLITSNIPFSALIMVAIAIDRYLCICHPFFHVLTVRRAKFMTAGLGVFATILGIVVSLMYGVTIEMSLPDFYSNGLLPVAAPARNDRYDNQPANQNTGYNKAIAHSQMSQKNVTIRLDVVLSESSENTTLVQEPFAQDTNNISNKYEDITKPANFKDSTKNNAANKIYIHSEICQPNTMILSPDFRWYYQKFYTAMFLLCLLVVVVLYTLIYKSVLQRRTKRQRAKNQVLRLVQNETTLLAPAGESCTMSTNVFSSDKSPPMAEVNGNQSKVAETSLSVSPTRQDSNGAIKVQTKELKSNANQQGIQNRKSTKRDRIQMANLKTAAMLFVVTVVFILTYLPAFLMTNEMIPYNMIVFYMYFANSVANPVIYSFMNKNFRDDLRKLFCSSSNRQ